ncbi:MAG: tRNA (adenosine(37)-N6)-threonylcarbamoyltransferase complex transferase subunit TsaD [Acidobacteria bacterium]|nr:tRNA (adenosine(37)-N6)-threonylcarbamoyltransferase complex transferase subunit TsaD [Acidobacteriota bacterium]
METNGPLLGIETSCDETSVALVARDGRVLASEIASQVAKHRPFGGVVPEIASREHLRTLPGMVEYVLEKGSASIESIEGVAVTSGPGLIGALLVGVAASQGICYGSGKPLVAVNHLEGHLFSAWLRRGEAALEVPRTLTSLVVSGGHSSIYRMADGRVGMLNRTRDDAAGEVFDKVAKFIGLPYPGGPHVDRIAKDGDANRFKFALPRFKDDSADFSFSGLKANAIRLARELDLVDQDLPREEQHADLADFCASFQKAVCDQLIDRLERIVGDAEPHEIGLTGGVAANSELRARFTQWCEEKGHVPRVAERVYCTDNGAMIAFAGWRKLLRGETSSPLRQPARSRWQPGEPVAV